MSSSGSDGIRRNLSIASNELKNSFDKLSSGKKSARENPAAAVVAQILDSEAAQIRVSSRNVSDGASLLNTFESTVSQVGGILERLGELATQAANGTLSDDQRGALNAEFTQLKDEIARQTASTEFNDVKFGDQVSIQIGGNSDQLSISTGDPQAINESLSSLDISSQSAAQNAIDLIGEATTTITALKGSFGAAQSRLESISSTLSEREVGVTAASSRIKDIDVADEVANLTAASIRQSSAVSVLNSFKNISAQTVAKLLQ